MDGLGVVLGGDGLGEVGDGAGHLQDAVVSEGGDCGKRYGWSIRL